MPYMEWNDTLSVGVTSVDAQHKKLVAMLNELFDAMSSERGQEVVIKTLDGLINYTVTHFAYEEQLFARTGYPEAAAHKKQHDELTKKVIAIREKAKSGVGYALTFEVMEFLKAWLFKHILGSDKRFGPHLISHNIK